MLFRHVHHEFQPIDLRFLGSLDPKEFLEMNHQLVASRDELNDLHVVDNAVNALLFDKYNLVKMDADHHL